MTHFEASALATPEGISALTDTVLAFLSEHGVEARPTHHVAMVLEEFLINLGTHGRCTDKPARISLTIEPDTIRGEIIDRGPPFDPRIAPDPILDTPLADRQEGGLGLYLVRKVTCALEYANRGGENCTRFAIARR